MATRENQSTHVLSNFAMRSMNIHDSGSNTSCITHAQPTAAAFLFLILNVFLMYSVFPILNLFKCIYAIQMIIVIIYMKRFASPTLSYIFIGLCYVLSISKVRLFYAI
jgi:hypothetical protein